MDDLQKHREEKEHLLSIVSAFANIAMSNTDFTDAGIKGILLRHEPTAKAGGLGNESTS